MGHTATDNFTACVQLLLVIGITLIGLAVMVCGVVGRSWLSCGIDRLITPLIVVFLRGLVVLTILGAIYFLAAHWLSGGRQDPTTGTSATQVVKYKGAYENRN